MSYNYIQSEYATERSSRLYISQMYRTIYSIINRILTEAEKDIVESKYNQEIKETIIETSKIRIDNLLNRFQDIILQFNSKFINQIAVSNESFSHIDKIEYLLNLQASSKSEIDMNAID